MWDVTIGGNWAEYMRALWSVSYDCMWIYSYLQIKVIIWEKKQSQIGDTGVKMNFGVEKVHRV